MGLVDRMARELMVIIGIKDPDSKMEQAVNYLAGAESLPPDVQHLYSPM